MTCMSALLATGCMYCLQAPEVVLCPAGNDPAGDNSGKHRMHCTDRVCRSSRAP